MKHDEQLEKAKEQALALMKVAGFSLKEDISVTLNPDLPYMGYTTEKKGKSVIVVSGKALESGAAVNLLIHEMSHAYRFQINHPSHDSELIFSLVRWVTQGRVIESYQEKSIYAIVNHIQDLYADDVAFKVFAKTPQQMNLNEFFLSWIHKPHATHSSKDIWENAEFLLDAAFAQANLERHDVKDTDEKVEKAVQDFLSKVDKKLAPKYDYFKKFMVDLPKEVTKKEFEKLLIEYLSEFLKLT